MQLLGDIVLILYNDLCNIIGVSVLSMCMGVCVCVCLELICLGVIVSYCGMVVTPSKDLGSHFKKRVGGN